MRKRYLISTSVAWHDFGVLLKVRWQQAKNARNTNTWEEISKFKAKI
jgi:hypothetical protein